MTKITKAVIPAAGYGTRMLPITRTLSKEMLPLVDKPIIQIVVEELVEAGITDIIIVTAARKTDIVDYFSEADPGLLAHLQAAGPAKAALVRQLEAVGELANFAFIEQRKGLYGTGVPVLDAQAYLGNEPFLFTFADDFFMGGPNSFRQLMDVYSQYGTTVLACQQRVTPADYQRYGYAAGDDLGGGLIDVRMIVEQPGDAAAAFGGLASYGGYLVTPDVWPYLHAELKDLPPGKELQFNASFRRMLADGKKVMAKELADLQYFDTGNKLEYMKTAVSMAAQHPEIGDDFRRFLIDFTEGKKTS